jgi:hypothetical protein
MAIMFSPIVSYDRKELLDIRKNSNHLTSILDEEFYFNDLAGLDILLTGTRS